MKIEIKSKYLIFPVNNFATSKTMCFYKDGKEVYKLNIRLDNVAPDYYAYIDLSRFYGSVLDISVSPDMEIKFTEADEINIEGLYNEVYRPQIHFTTKNGWINDPNGLIYFNGEYHMFYQHNPCENNWGNMHWGHAVSKDIIHWEERDIALFPDMTGAMFSGCAIVDEKNLLGLQSGDVKTVLLYYTATEPYMQYVAYSTDGLKSVKKLDKAVVPTIEKFNRDPKVIFCEEWRAYVMALYLEKDVYGLLRSDDLLNWKLVQKIAMSGDRECPDLFSITADNGEKMWVLMGANDRYIVGKMQKNSFVPVQDAASLNYGGTAYAGQSFSNLEDGRCVRIDWDRWNISTPRISGQMSIPMELSLSKRDDQYYLCANPVKELDCLVKTKEHIDNFELKADVKKRIELEGAPYEFKMKCKLGNGVIKMTLFGCLYTIDLGANSLKYGNGRSVPIALTSDGFELTLIVDKCSAELYLDGGKIYSGSVDEKTVCDYNLPYLELSSSNDTTLEYLEIYKLGSVWG